MTDIPARHLPVMAAEVVALLGSAPGHVLADLTVGAGGHAGAFLRATAPTGRVIASDRDVVALDLARERLADFGDRVRFVHADWVSALERLRADGVEPDAILMDLGVSSMQLDDPERGFSLREDGPLDMRMDQSGGPTAADFLNSAKESELETALAAWGEEPHAAKIARAIARRRRERPFRTTGDLRTVVETALGRRFGRIHPATRTFQAVRMAVNGEMALLEAAVPAAIERLAPGGRLAILSFHSGEDRVVKQLFREAAREG
ncbi:MAG: 16S rRNA (cytosine(1402)-N(4))-methyltransferase RsmH, partial [Planctomycetota bacterium]